MKTKTFLFLPLIFLIACGPSASEIDAKVKAALKNQQDSITNSEKLGADSIAKIEAELSKSQDNAVVNNELQWNYSGSIDKYKIKAQVNYGEGTNSEGTGALEIPITGYYFYESQNQKIQIKGSSNGAGTIYLVAHTNGGDETFDGQFTGSMLEDFSGTWEKNGKQLKFNLISKK